MMSIASDEESSTIRATRLDKEGGGRRTGKREGNRQQSSGTEKKEAETYPPDEGTGKERKNNKLQKIQAKKKITA